VKFDEYAAAVFKTAYNVDTIAALAPNSSPSPVTQLPAKPTPSGGTANGTANLFLETGVDVTYCLRRWCDRGAGTIPNTCVNGSPFGVGNTEESALLCYPPCNVAPPVGAEPGQYVRYGFRCYHDCASLAGADAPYLPAGLGLCVSAGARFDPRKFRARPAFNRNYGLVLGCANDNALLGAKDYVAGLCYTPCPTEYDAQVTMCRQRCAPGMTRCGIFCIGAGNDAAHQNRMCTVKTLALSAKIIAGSLALAAGIGGVVVASVATGGAATVAAGIVVATLGAAGTLFGAADPIADISGMEWCALGANSGNVPAAAGLHTVGNAFADAFQCNFNA